jgi:hypothetical protein
MVSVFRRQKTENRGQIGRLGLQFSSVFRPLTSVFCLLAPF